MEFWRLLNSDLGLLVLGFVFTTVAGTLLTRVLQDRAWHRQTRVDLFRKRHEQGVDLLDQVSRLIGARTFTLQRLIWALSDGDQAAIKTWQSASGKIVFRWNVNRWNIRNKIRLLLGEPQATAFLDDRDYHYPETPASIHYRFVRAHQYAIDAQQGRISVAVAQEELDVLQRICALFLEALTTEFTERANALDLLKEPNQSPARPPLAAESVRGVGQIIDTSNLKLLPRVQASGDAARAR